VKPTCRFTLGGGVAYNETSFDWIANGLQSNGASKKSFTYRTAPSMIWSPSHVSTSLRVGNVIKPMRLNWVAHPLRVVPESSIGRRLDCPTPVDEIANVRFGPRPSVCVVSNATGLAG
jgi:hypothetical protein